MMKTTLTQVFVVKCDIVTQSCPLHPTIESMRGPVRFTMPFIVLSWEGDVVSIGQKTLREKLGIDAMTQLKRSVLKLSLIHI